MTNDQVEKAIEFLLEQDANLTAKLEALTGDVRTLAETQDRMQKEAEAGRAEARAIREDMLAMQEEVRGAVGKMLGFAEAMASNVAVLTQAQQGNTQRIATVERRIDAAGIPPDPEKTP
jgi:chromosome segregation ATPase